MRHGIARVDDQIHQDLIYLARVGFDFSKRRLEAQSYFYVLANQTAQHLARIRNHVVEIQHLRLQHLLTAESE